MFQKVQPSGPSATINKSNNRRAPKLLETSDGLQTSVCIYEKGIKDRK